MNLNEARNKDDIVNFLKEELKTANEVACYISEISNKVNKNILYRDCYEKILNIFPDYSCALCSIKFKLKNNGNYLVSHFIIVSNSTIGKSTLSKINATPIVCIPNILKIPASPSIFEKTPIYEFEIIGEYFQEYWV